MLPGGEVEALTEYGHCFGMVFQIRDDILDITATEGELLKPAGQDLAEGIYTLPALVALADPDSGPNLRALLGNRWTNPSATRPAASWPDRQAFPCAVDSGPHATSSAARAATAGIAVPELP